MSLHVRAVAVVVCLLAGVAWPAGPALAQPAQQPQAAPPPTQTNVDDRQLRLAEPDFTLVNLPTSLALPLHGGNFRLTHRFLGNLRQGSFSQQLGNLFGLDNGAVIGLEFRYAPVRNLQVIVHRSSLDKTWQFAGQYGVVRQGAGRPLAIAAIASVEGTRNFRSGTSSTDDPVAGHRSPAFGAVLSHALGDRLALYAVPMWVHHSAALPEGHRDTGFIGVGGRARIRMKVYVVAEVSPRVGGYTPGSPEFAFGLERRAGGHMFQLTFTNAIATTFGQVSQGGFPTTIYLGFNLGRKFF